MSRTALKPPGHASNGFSNELILDSLGLPGAELGMRGAGTRHTYFSPPGPHTFLGTWCEKIWQRYPSPPCNSGTSTSGAG